MGSLWFRTQFLLLYKDNSSNSPRCGVNFAHSVEVDTAPPSRSAISGSCASAPASPPTGRRWCRGVAARPRRHAARTPSPGKARAPPVERAEHLGRCAKPHRRSIPISRRRRQSPWSVHQSTINNEAAGERGLYYNQLHIKPQQFMILHRVRTCIYYFVIMRN